MEVKSVSFLKRRLGRAMVECRTQASRTANKLAAQMQRTSRRPAHQTKRHFSYNFVLDHGSCASDGQCDIEPDDQQTHANEPQQDGEQNHTQLIYCHNHEVSPRIAHQTMDTKATNTEAIQRPPAISHQKLEGPSRPATGSRGQLARSSTRSRSSARRRQVRFHPVAQSMEPAKLKRTKPLARRLNHMKLNAIKLRSFNSLAQQLHRTLASTTVSLARLPHQKGAQMPPTPTANQLDHPEEPKDEDEFDWGSDFDEQSADSSLASGQQSTGADPQGGYLLEIGRASGDQRAIDDVIQDQGICGQFKRLDMSSDLGATRAEASATPSCSDEHDDEDDDDEAELRSLEARQGFRQIKDKLKVIFDQRMAQTDVQTNDCQGAATPSDSRQQSSAKLPRGEFDCQSHCSEDSSGLESNHSGSQDSGHSTQSSGYSTREEATGKLAASQQTSPVLSPTGAQAKSPADEDPEQSERRNRFLQNRLIINDKLESMFKGREPATVASKAAPSLPGPGAPSNGGSALASSQQQAASQSLSSLLEQQRQMSLKLKQKPRRKSAKSIAKTLGATCEQDDEAQDYGSYAQNGGHLQRTGSKRQAKRESLTKQLSMICLRKAGQLQMQTNAQLEVAPAPSTIHQVDESALRSPLAHDAHVLADLQPRPCPSLRQLIKETIDDCEKPSKLSTLTRNALNRSDSLSSELATSAEELTRTVGAESPRQRLASRRASSDQSTSASTCSLDQPAGSVSGISATQEAPRVSAKLFGPGTEHLAPRLNCRRSPLMRSPMSQAQVDVSMSSAMSSIDGLELGSRSFSSSCELALSSHIPQPQDPGPPPASGAPQQAKQQPAKSTLGSYLKTLRDFSRNKLPKMRLHGAGSSSKSEPWEPQATNTRLANPIGLPVSMHCDPFSPPLVGHSVPGNRMSENLAQSRVYQRQLECDGSSTLAGAWRRRTKRNSCLEAPVYSSSRIELNSGAAADDALTNHFVTISNRRWKSCHLRTSLMQIVFTNGQFTNSQNSTYNNLTKGACDQANLSPKAKGRQNLAYLNNSKNFTDDDI